MAGTASISGLISGLKTDDIISKMSEFAQRPIKIIKGKQAGYTAQLTAWQDVNTRLLALKTKASTLTNPFSFREKTATVSDDTLLGVSVTGDAAPGTFDITINRLAQAEMKQSQGYPDTGKTLVGTGTLEVGVGTSAKTLTIDSSNNTLSGLRDTINQAGVGVTATIVDFGSSNTHDYHLQLTGKSTGADNTITFNPSLTGGTSPSLTTITPAQDASITVGPPGNTTTLTKSTNTINDVYQGVVLNLKGADAGKSVKLTVSENTAAVKDKIKDFVDQYNGVIDFINDQFSYDSETKSSGVLFGDFALQNVEQDLRTMALDVVPGLPAGMNTLSQVGITSDSRDHLVINDTDLDVALSKNPDGVMKLFADNGTSTDYSVTYQNSSAQTKDAGAAGFKVRIDQPAAQARVTAGAAQTANLSADETLTLNNTAIKLTAGMTPQQVMDEVNKFTSSTGVIASRTGADGTGTGDFLTFTRTGYGSGFSIVALSTASNGGAAPVADTSGLGKMQVSEKLAIGETGTGTGNAGKNVSGAFGVTTGGVTTWEDATGTGQLLVGKSGNANTDGLTVKSTATTAGEHGSVSLTRGIAGKLNHLLDYLTGKNGSVTTAQDTLNKQISDLGDEITQKNQMISDYEDQLRLKFANLEGTMGQLQSQGSYLSSQFAALAKK